MIGVGMSPLIMFGSGHVDVGFFFILDITHFTFMYFCTSSFWDFKQLCIF